MAQGYHLLCTAAISLCQARSSDTSHGCGQRLSEYQVLNSKTEAHMTGTQPGSSNENKNDPGFDEKSPNTKDPQIDPTEPAKTPATEKGSKDDYPPYTPDK